MTVWPRPLRSYRDSMRRTFDKHQPTRPKLCLRGIQRAGILNAQCFPTMRATT
jgi:hypothetical protein